MYQPGGCSEMRRQLLIIATRAIGFSILFYSFLSPPSPYTCLRDDQSRALRGALHVSPPRPAFVNSRCNEKEVLRTNCTLGRCDPLSERWISCHCRFGYRDRHVGGGSSLDALAYWNVRLVQGDKFVRAVLRFDK